MAGNGRVGMLNLPAETSPAPRFLAPAQLTSLSALHTLVLKEVSVGSAAYSALEQLPRLRRLHCVDSYNCQPACPA